MDIKDIFNIFKKVKWYLVWKIFIKSLSL